jgi:predicted nucleic acid-binding protein
MTDKVFVDSNVWVYLFTNEDNAKSKIAERFILENSLNHILVISYQVINEVTNVLKKKGFGENQIRFVIENMAKICAIQDYSKDIMLLASTLREKHAFSFWDSLIVASASIAQCRYLASEDMQDGQVISKTTIKNIFKV